MSTNPPGPNSDADPLAWVGASGSALAALAFGAGQRNAAPDLTHLRHLALLPVDALELDLSDPAQRQFGDYELLELIGEGGMGVVYRARQISLDREVAVKLLAAGPWASRDFIERFRREAQNAARMQHPNIVAIYEVGDAEELHFFSMRLVRGQSLAERVRDVGPLDPQTAAKLIRTAAEALAYAHSLGLLHLDLKPANVLLDEDGVPHLADFGLARRLDSTLAIDNEEVSGTPSYMSPEQAQPRTHKLSAATDIWGLGAILYELVTGQPPFRGPNAKETINLVVAGQVDHPRRSRREVPLDLDAIILKCLEAEPSKRYESARALADDLGRFAEHRAVRARPLDATQRLARWFRREPKLAGALLFALIALVAGLLTSTLQSQRAKRNETRAEQNADLAQHTLWTSRTGTAQREIAAGDAYAALGNTAANLREMETHGERAEAALQRLRIGTVLANAPQLIDVIPLVGNIYGSGSLAISPDATTFAAVTAGRIVRLFDIASGTERWDVNTTDKSFGMTAIHNWSIGDLRFSDDGHRLVAYTLDNYPGGAQSTMRPHYVDSVLIDIDAGTVVEPPKAFSDFLATSYSDDGRYALLFDTHGAVQRWRTLPWSPAGDKVELGQNLNYAVNAGPLLGEAMLANNSETMVLVSDANLEFHAFDSEHMRPLHTLMLDSTQGRATTWALRHDGKQLAIGTMTGQISLWNLNDGTVAWLRSQLSGQISILRFSADDGRLLAVSSAPSELRVFNIRTRTLVAEPVKLDTQHAPNVESGTDAFFGADSRTLLTRQWSGNATLWRLPAQGFPLQAPIAGAPVMVATGTRFALATDARSRLMVSADNGQAKLWRLRPSPLMDRVGAPMVTETLRFDGRHLVSVEENRVSVFDVATDRSVGATITLPQVPTYAGLDGDGSQLIMLAGRELSCWNWRSGTPCWPTIVLPDSALRLSIAADAPVLAVSTGSNEIGDFFEHVRLIDLATGRQRGAPIALRGPLGALRLSDDGRRLLAWQDRQSEKPEANLLYLIDTKNAAILQRLAHPDGDQKQVVSDARFLADGSIWSASRAPWNTIGGSYRAPLWHWDTSGRLMTKVQNSDGSLSLQTLLATSGIIPLQDGQRTKATAKPIHLPVSPPYSRDNADAVSADGRLLALATINGVTLTDIAHNERLLPDFKLPLPNDEVVQQLAFAPDGSRLVGRTTSGRWFQWRLVADQRPVDAIERDISAHDLTPRDKTPSAWSVTERRQLRAADLGPAAIAPTTHVVNVTNVRAVADSAQEPLDLDTIANVDPRAPMNHATRLPPQPQSLPSLPRGLQRYDGIDFMLNRAVQLSGKPQNVLDAAFPAESQPLAIGSKQIAFVDTLVMQYLAALDIVGTVHLHYADGGERLLDIKSPRDSREHWIDAERNAYPLRIGWLGSFAQQMLYDGPGAGSEETLSRSYIVRLRNPDPDRPVVSISLSAPPDASPGLLFLALTLEPINRKH